MKLRDVGDLSRRQALACTGLGLLSAQGSLAHAPGISLGRGERHAVTVTQATNIALTVSPDGQSLAMDLLGILWTVPIGGGPAVRLTDIYDDVAQPDWSPDGRHILFHSYRSGNFHLWSVTVSGGPLTQLTDGAFDHREPRWSPDGRTVAFSSDRTGGRYAIHLLDVATGKVRLFSQGSTQDSEPCWSPDGQNIAYVTQGREILLAPLFGGPPTRIASVPPSPDPLRPSEIHAPAFAPDGALWYTTIVDGAVTLIRDGQPVVAAADLYPFRPAFAGPNAYLTAADGKIIHHCDGKASAVAFAAQVPVVTPTYRRKRRDFTSIKSRPVKGIVGPQLSPDGRNVLFCALNDIYLMEIGKAPRKLVSGPFAKCDPAWSPDGQRIVYSTDKGGTLDLWLVEVATGTERQLTNLPDMGLGSSCWSRDGKTIACLDQDGALYGVDVATGAVRNLFGALWQPGRPSFGPDGTTIACAAFRPVSPRYREGLNEILTIDTVTGKASYQPVMTGKSLGVRGLDGPIWSSDGTAMAFVFASTLWVVSVDSTGKFAGVPRQITTELADAPSWSGDSQFILYLSAGKLRIVPARGGRPETVPCRLTWTNAISKRRTIIRADRIWDGAARSYAVEQDVIIAGNQIKAIVPRGTATDVNATFIDGTGQTLLPGLIDIHTHRQMAGYNFGDRMGRILLALGITATRSPGAPAYHMVEDREAIDSGARIAPRHYATGEAIDGGRIFYNFMRPLTEPGQLELEMERARALDYDMVKTYVRLRHDIQQQVTEAAHAMGVPVSSHYHYPALYSGVDGMEHMGATNRLGYSRTMTALGGGYQDVNGLFGAAQAARTPTLATANALLNADSSITRDPRIRILFPPWEYRKLLGRLDMVKGKTGDILLASLERQVQQIHDMIAAGGIVTSGTDMPIDLVGISLHNNLRGMVRFGVAPVDALMSATGNAGRFLREPIGRIARGMLADLVLVEGDPLARIEDAAAVRVVIANGHAHTPQSLMEPFVRPEASTVRNPILAPVAMRDIPYWHSAAYVETARGACCADHWHPSHVHHA